MEHLPQWKPDEEKPPLSLTKAIQIAAKWIAKRSGGGDVETILIRPVGLANDQFRYIYFYQIKFGVNPIDNYMTCIVLMDGTVLEPEP